MSRIPSDTPCVIDSDSVFIWNFYNNKTIAQFNCDKLNKKSEKPHYIVTTYENYVNMQENTRAQH